MKRLLVPFLILISACSSQNDITQPPLDRNKMIDVLVDIHLLEAQKMSSPQARGRVYQTIVGYEKIFLKHKVTREQFNESFSYYRQHPDKMDELYQEMIDEVTRRESEISSEAAKERLEKSRSDTSKAKTDAAPPQLNEW